MSAVELDTTAESGVHVDLGDADVFVIDADGALIPLGTIGIETVVLPLNDSWRLRVIGRMGAQLSEVPKQPTAESLLTLQTLIAPHVSGAATLEAETYPSILIPLLEQRVAAYRSRAIAAQELSAQADTDLISSVDERITFAVENLTPLQSRTDEPPLQAVLRIVGSHEGFAVAHADRSDLQTSSDPLRYLAHRSGVRYRSVTLSKGWSQSTTSTLLGFLASGSAHPVPVALIHGRGGYFIQQATDLTPHRLRDTDSLLPQAFEFYAPVRPGETARPIDLLRLGLHGSLGLLTVAAATSLGVALLGLLTPWLTNTTVGTIIPQGRSGLLIQVGLGLTLAAVVATVFSVVQSYAVAAVTQRATRAMQSALWDRLLSMPADFFRAFSSGDLTVRVLAVDQLQGLISVQVLSALLAALFGLVNFVLMFIYAPTLALVALVILLLGVLAIYLGIRSISGNAELSLQASRRANGWLVQMLRGISKIRIAGAESRMESEYLQLAERQAVASARETLTVGRISAWFIFILSAGPAFFILMVGLQWTEGSVPISTAAYLAFASAYGLAFAAITGLSSLISPLATARPVFSLLDPILQHIPESAGTGQDPGRLQGHIELRDVVFRYTSDGPAVLTGLNLDIRAGEMVALVGPSGAGKSTITRLLLGFDFPESGQILLDGRDLQDLDLPSVRQQMGVVVQEGTITRGSILRNILGAGHNDESVAWSAAEKAALADDIRAMPMQMQTIIDPANISGGQAQRILLARALVREPRILILDEATSALDNAAQFHITEAMAALEATRVVVAHRLSTIRQADRIVVLVAGQACEVGDYDELMSADGIFASLVKRQTA
jgi:NHLM bacteriocin system ABC transporter ATP-binding protein